MAVDPTGNLPLAYRPIIHGRTAHTTGFRGARLLV
jgi:hypothetical protein